MPKSNYNSITRNLILSRGLFAGNACGDVGLSSNNAVLLIFPRFMGLDGVFLGGSCKKTSLERLALIRIQTAGLQEPLRFSPFDDVDNFYYKR